MRSPIMIGFIQALDVVGYTLLVGSFFSWMEHVAADPPQLLAITLMLTLFVFSVALVGLLIFGYGAYLVFRGRMGDALRVVGSTLGFVLLFIVAGVVIATIA